MSPAPVHVVHPELGDPLDEPCSASLDRYLVSGLRALGVVTWRELQTIPYMAIATCPSVGRWRLKRLKEEMVRRGATFGVPMQAIHPHCCGQGRSNPTTGVYFLRCLDFVKVGMAVDIPQRVNALQNAWPLDLIILGVLRTATAVDAAVLERQWHGSWDAIRHRGEWFRATPELLDAIKAESEPL